MHVRIAFIESAQLRRGTQRLVKRDVKIARHKLCHTVNIAVGHTERASDITNGKLRLHRAERHYLRHILRAVFRHYIFYYSLPPLRRKIYIYIRHTDALRI